MVHLPCVNLADDGSEKLLAGLGSSAEEAGVASSSSSSPSSSGGAAQLEGKDPSKAQPIAYVVSIIGKGTRKQVEFLLDIILLILVSLFFSSSFFFCFIID